MGVLDDAIREHLDLKRRHGVAEEELRRQEEEALGPARREVAPEEAEEDGAAAVDGAADAAPAEAPLAKADEPELSEPLPETELHSDIHDDELGEEELLPLDQPTEAHAPVEEAPPRGDTPAAGFEELDDDELLDEEEPPAEEEDLDDEAEGGEGDLLEDTPDFLEETPEHDRLWFEQKPPRDFDFD